MFQESGLGVFGGDTDELDEVRRVDAVVAVFQTFLGLVPFLVEIGWSSTEVRQPLCEIHSYAFEEHVQVDLDLGIRGSAENLSRRVRDPQPSI